MTTLTNTLNESEIESAGVVDAKSDNAPVTDPDPDRSGTPGVLLNVMNTQGGSGMAPSQQGLMSWTAPNDGNIHIVTIAALVDVVSTATGGQVTVSYHSGGHAISNQQLLAGSLATGQHFASLVIPVDGDGGQVLVFQNTAITGGEANFYGAIAADHA